MEDALKLLAANLKELQTDHADLVYAHSIGSDKMDPELVMGKDGTMAALAKARAEGLTRFVGISSGHNRPARFVTMLERFPIDVMMNAVNLGDRYTYGFEEKVWPLAAEKQVGLVAMKVFGGTGGSMEQTSSNMPDAHLSLAFRYAMSLPNVCTVVIGMANGVELQQNIERVRAFQPLTADERQQAERVGRELAAKWGPHFGAVA
jgi:predicted aldo/keto reductase-like oxidoreductase